MDFYTNIHKSRGDRGSSFTASVDAISPFNYSVGGKRGSEPAEAAPGPPAAPGRGGGGEGAGEGEHYLLEVFKFIARMMFLISTAAIN